MKLANQMNVSLFKEGFNVLKVLPSYYLNKTLTRPVSVNLIISTRCNSKCITCDSWKLKDHDNELALNHYENLAKSIKELNIPLVTIGGGEPTIHPQFFKIINIFKNNGCIVQVTSNGLTLRDKMLEQIYESGIDRLTISVDSHLPDVYQKIRGVDGAAKVLENIKQIMRTKPKHLSIDTNTVLCFDNANTFLNTLDHLISMQIPKINFSAVTTFQNNYLMQESKENLRDISLSLIEDIVRGLLQRKKSTTNINASTAFIEGLIKYYKHPDRLVFPCYAGFLTLDIFQDGSVHGCGNLPSIANIKNTRLERIWSSDQAVLNRKNMAEGKCPNCYLSCKAELSIASMPSHLPQFAFEKILST